jgi:hypothetical protein
MKKNHLWIPIVLILFIVTIVGLVILVPLPGSAEQLETEQTYGVLEDDSWSYNLEFDQNLVMQIQRALNKYLKKHDRDYRSISVDGVFGCNTANAVKLFQYHKGLAIDGICGPKTLAALGINADNVEVYPRWVPNLEESFAKSTTGLAFHLNLGSHRLEAYRLIDGEWYLIRVMLCATGNASAGYFTDLRDGLLDGKKHVCISGGKGKSEWRGDYATHFGGGDYTHTILAHKRNGKWSYDKDNVLGKSVSHGCIRLKVEDAKWIYEHASKGDARVIDDRAWEHKLTN